MKLYTEEQVNLAMRLMVEDRATFKQTLELLTPIELPSDEEIGEQTKEITSFTSGTAKTIVESYYYSGALWMREQILNKTNNL